MSEEGYSLSSIERELDEMKKDYDAFSSAYDIVRRRLVESNEAQPPRAPLLHTWSGSRAVCGSFELAIHSIERTIDELTALAKKVRSGELKNTDPPRPFLSLVKETETP